MHAVHPSYGPAAGGTRFVLRGGYFPTARPPRVEARLGSTGELADKTANLHVYIMLVQFF